MTFALVIFLPSFFMSSAIFVGNFQLNQNKPNTKNKKRRRKTSMSELKVDKSLETSSWLVDLMNSIFFFVNSIFQMKKDLQWMAI